MGRGQQPRLALLLTSGLLALVTLSRAGLAATPALPLSIRTIQFQPGEPGDPPPVVTAVALHPNGRWVATAGDDHLIRIVELPSGRVVRTLTAHRDWVGAVAFSPDGQSMVTAGRDERIVMWDLNADRARWTLSDVDQDASEQGPPSTIRFSHDGQWVAVVGFARSLQVLDASTGRAQRRLKCPCRDMRCLAFSRDDQWIAAAGRNGRVRVWNVDAGSEHVTIDAHRQRVRDLVFDHATGQLITAGEDRTVRAWDPKTGQAQFSLAGVPGKVLSMTTLPDGRLATACSDNVIRVWDLREQRLVSQLRGHQGSVAALDANQRWLVSASFDATVRVWPLAAMEDAIAALERQRTRTVTEQRDRSESAPSRPN